MDNKQSAATEDRSARGKPSRNKVLDQILAPEEPDQKQSPIVMASNLTPEEQAIYRRVISDSEDWKTITEDEALDYSLSRDPFELPAPALKLQKNKEFAFRWITRRSERLDEIKNKPVPFKWWPVNLNQPVGTIFKAYIDPNNGCVSREDQMLVFKPYWMFEKELAYKRGLADVADTNRLESLHGQTRKAGRDADVEIIAGKRSGLESKTLRQEIKGSDIQFKGEEEVDIEAGRSFPVASESDLNVEE